jgi:peroxiredoxin
MKLRNTLAWIALVIGALAITYTYAPSRRTVLVEASKRTVGPDFTLRDVQGKEVKLSDYKGKMVILNLWATWCGPCKVEIPWFKEFETTYKDRGLAVVGVAFDEEGWQVVTPYVAEAKMNYQILLGDKKFPLPYGDFEALPTTYLIDKQGRIAGKHVGLVAKATYEEEIDQLLKN